MNRNLMGIFLVLLFAAAVPPAPSQVQTPPLVRTLIYSLEPGEEIMSEESMLVVNLDDVILVLTKGPKGPFSVFRDGKKSKPFSDLKEAMKAAYEGRKGSSGEKSNCATYRPGSVAEDIRPWTDDVEGGQVVRFKDKTVGPFVLAYSVTATPDGARAYFAANEKDSAVFGCTDGRKVAVGGIPGEYKFSPNGLNAAVLCQGTTNPIDQTLPPEQVAAGMDKKYLYTIDGKKYGPFSTGFGEGYGDFWFVSTGNDLYYETSDGQIFRNGVAIMKTSWVDPCSFHPSPDGKKYGLFSDEKIVFSDGQKFPSPLDIAVFTKNGQTMVKWITLEKKKDLVIYQRAM
jgi:hypothetical protein